MDRELEATACLSDDELVSLRRGALEPAAQRRALRHLQGCADCRSRANAVLSELTETRSPTPGPRPGGPIEGTVTEGSPPPLPEPARSPVRSGPRASQGLPPEAPAGSLTVPDGRPLSPGAEPTAAGASVVVRDGTATQPPDPPAAGPGTVELSSGGRAPPRAASLERGTGLGRYVVLEKRGEGGMGVVYAAWDPDLDRRVALKLLRAETTSTEAAHKRARLLREAQAMARLSHRNVITVYDVGTLGDQIFVAMEYVDGRTLGAWMREKPRPWRDVLANFLRAGRGLAAAHAAGLVHRDFKPDNVLIGKDGRVRVTDFGLARPASSAEDAAAMLGVPLTDPGMLLGTPAYMAPEQLERKEADERSDQFSFCVALYEALYGARPFNGRTPRELLPEVLAGRVRPPPADSPVPAYVRKAILKGLSVKPAERFRSMDELLAMLRRDPRKLWRTWLGTAAALACLGLALGAVVASRVKAPPLCQGAEARLAGIWDGPRKEAIKSAFLATGKPFAAGAYAAVERALDDYTAEWIAGHTDACEATRLRREQSEAMMEVRMLCLDRRRQELDALTGLFAAADAQTVERAVQATRALTPIKGCADLTALTSHAPLPEDPAARPQAQAILGELARVKGVTDAGRYAAALEKADAALKAARVLHFRPVEAEALGYQGLLRWYLTDLKGADEALSEAVLAAEAGRSTATAAVAWVNRVGVAADQHSPLAHEHARHARALLEAMGGDDRLLTRLLLYEGNAFFHEGDYTRAQEKYRQAIGILEKGRGADELTLAGAYSSFALMLDHFGHYDEALAYHRRALSIYEKALGPDHPGPSQTLSNIGMLFYEQGKYDDALEMLGKALALQERALGDGLQVAITLNNVGNVLMDEGKLEDARAQFERAVRILDQVLGPDSFQAAFSLANLGTVRQRGGRPAQGLALHRKALAIIDKTSPQLPDKSMFHTFLAEDLIALRRFPEAMAELEHARDLAVSKLGPGHARVAEALADMGAAFAAQGRHREALEKYEAALGIHIKALGPDSVVLAMELTGVGVAHLALSEPELAVAPLERALALREKTPVDPALLAETRFALARALWEGGGDRARARALATQAVEGFARAGESRKRELAEAKAWLASRG